MMVEAENSHKKDVQYVCSKSSLVALGRLLKLLMMARAQSCPTEDEQDALPMAYLADLNRSVRAMIDEQVVTHMGKSAPTMSMAW